MLPRNAVYVAPPALPAPEEDDDDEGDDDDEESDEPSTSSPSWVVAAEGIIRDVAPAVGAFVSKRWPRNAAAQAPSTAAPAAVAVAAPAATAPRGPNPMVHLAEINDRLTDPEREILRSVLRKPKAGVLTQDLLALIVDDAVAYVTDMIERNRAGYAAEPAPAPAPPSAAEETEASAPDFMAHVAAIAVLLSREERAAVLALLPTFPIERREQLEAQLLAMTRQSFPRPPPKRKGHASLRDPLLLGGAMGDRTPDL